jgi:YHS domain-containing protein
VRTTEEDEMAMVTDPVCGMILDSEEAAATASHDGTTYFFCSQVCHDAFVANPGAFLE